MERNRCLDEQEMMAIYQRPHFDSMEKRHKDRCENCSVKFRNLVSGILNPIKGKMEKRETVDV